MSLGNRKKSIPCTIDRQCERPPPVNLAVHAHNGNAPCECIKCMEKSARLLAGTGTSTGSGTNCTSTKKQQTKFSNPSSNDAQGMRNYATPQLNYALRHQCQMDTVQEKYKQVKFQLKHELPRCSNTVIDPKVAQKMNFRPEATVFKNLVPLNVNDSLLIPHRSTHPVKKRTLDAKGTNGCPEPELHNFVEELDKLEHIIPEPDFELYYTNEEFDYLQSYTNLYAL